jgi:hypothetical protein
MLRVVAAAIVALTVASTLALAGVPPLSEEFRFSSDEYDDTTKSVSLRQTIAQSLRTFRLFMRAQGQLVGGFLEQLTDCSKSPDGKNGTFTEIGGCALPSASCVCQVSPISMQWTPFWDFPPNATFMGKKAPPSGSYPPLPMWQYWDEGDKYELFMNQTAAGWAPVWYGKTVVSPFHPTYHKWHFEYFDYVIGTPSDEYFVPVVPAGVKCTSSAQPPQRFIRGRGGKLTL